MTAGVSGMRLVIEHGIELAVGEVVEIGPVRVTVLDVEGDEVTLRVDSPNGGDTASLVTTARLPR